ncbi:MAG: LLM class flavin-dependent oxidoreductase [Actinobacteria bacterium]|nr:LLM class flavin-dependent oxidoreductase [Actinomycetota bacterium]
MSTHQSGSGRVGICFPDRPDFPTLLAAAKQADAKGFESIWVFETRLARDWVSQAGAIAAVTTRAKIAPGVTNSWSRPAPIMAMTLATLDEMAPGRMMLGIGAWWEPLASKVGVDRRKPLTQIREYVEVFDRLMALERVTYHGELVHVDDLELDLAEDRPRIPMHIPVLIGATGPKMLHAAPQFADGVLLNFMTSPSYTADAVARIRAGAEEVGRDPNTVVHPQIIACAMDEDGDRARDVSREMLTMYLGQQPHIGLASGLSADYVAELHDRMGGWPPEPGGLQRAMALVDDTVVDQFTASGTPDECLAAARRYVDAGAEYPIPVVLTPETTMEIVEAFADFT